MSWVIKRHHELLMTECARQVKTELQYTSHMYAFKPVLI